MLGGVGGGFVCMDGLAAFLARDAFSFFAQTF